MKRNSYIWKKAAALLLAAVLCITAFPVASFALETADGLVYTAQDGEITITQYAGDDTQITVPASINGDPVTEIAPGAFSYKSKLQSVTLPETVETIGMMAFFACEALSEINIADLQNLTYIGAYAFVDTALSGELILPQSVTEIGAAAFGMTNLSALHLGKNVGPVRTQSAEPWITAFKNAGFDLSENFGFDVSFLIDPYETTAQQKNIAPNCDSLKRITVDSANPYYRAWGGVLFSRDMTELYCYPAGKAASIYIMPSTVERFYDAFGGLHLPNISIRLFGDLDPMDNNLLPEGWIDFGAALQLENVVLSANVKEISKAAFYNTGITSIFIPKSVTSIGEKAFWHCRNLTTVGFDRGSVYTELPKACFQDCEALQNVTFGKIEYLSALVFAGCTSLTSIDLTNVAAIDSSAFDDCTNLEEVVYRDDDSAAATVSAQAFQNTDSLSTALLGSAVESVEAYAFADCDALETVYISDAVEEIDDTAFDGSDNLTIVCPSETCYAYTYAKANNIPVTTLVLSPIANQTFTGAAIEPELTVTASGKTLTQGTDFEAFYKDNVHAGTASVTVLGKGAYSMFASIGKFAITQRDLSDGVACGGIAAQTAADEPCEPAVALTFNDYILELGTDYLLAYSDNTAPGTAHVTVTGIGNFTGELALTFEITEAPPLPDEVLPGDVSGDGILALADYALLASACVGSLQLTEAQFAAADLNGDGAVDGFDLALMDIKLNTSTAF